MIHESKIHREALLNELKGILFEFLIGTELAKSAGIENQFLSELDQGYRRQLEHYQGVLLKEDQQLLKSLPTLARACVSQLELKLPPNANQIRISSIDGPHKHKFAEADVIVQKQGVEIPISLKLGKHNSYVNTKSAGVKSVYKKYFEEFPDHLNLQKVLNEKVEKGFYKMGSNLYHEAGLVFSGRFGGEWEQAGYSTLPGELPSSFKKYLAEFYHELALAINKDFQNLSQQDSKLFAKCLRPLCGFGHPDLIQLRCYHTELNHLAHQLKDIKVIDKEELDENIKNLRFLPMRPGLSSFELDMPLFRLQIRVKPMNVFTTPSYKINCSVKQK